MEQAPLAWRVEETCLNAWPALQQVLFDGWVLRFSRGLSRRANSANPLAGARGATEPLIAGCEALFRRHRLPTIFRLPSLVGGDVDARLAARGYREEGLSLVLHTGLERLAAARDAEVRLMPRPSPRWFAAMASLQRHSPEQAATYRRIIGVLAIPAAFAALRAEGEIAALGYGAVHRGLLCYQSLVTDPSRRRRGYAGRIIASLAAWARAEGATGACLEVEAGNAPALALYRRLGFAELYRYQYRRHEAASGTG